MENEKYLQDLRDIREMMSKSTQFISLSGLSGVMAGVYALAGAFVADSLMEWYKLKTGSAVVPVDSPLMTYLILTAFVVLALSVGTALIMTAVKANRKGESVWNSTSKRLAFSFLIPLAVGGIYTVLLLRQNHYGLVSSAMLIFYGLACINASKYTFRDVHYIGLTMIGLGLAAAAFPGYGLLFWAIGFGACHIVYGTIMHFKYDRK